MGSSFQYSINSAFKAISYLQTVIVKNAQGLLEPGYNKQEVHFGQMPGGQLAGSRDGTQEYGSAGSMTAGGDSLSITGTTIHFEQGTIEPAFDPTSLAIRGDGFFLVAENLRPGARVFLTRAGDFHYDAQGRLVNPQGLFVVGGNGKLTDPPTPVMNPGDGTVHLPELTLGTVLQRSELSVSGYGDNVYQTNVNTGPIKAFANGRKEVGFVQSSSIEVPDKTGAGPVLAAETTTATQTYNLIKQMLDNFNKTNDDATGLVK